MANLTVREALELVCDLAGQEWQNAEGKRFAATDNSGKRMWFISDDVMQEARAALAGRRGEGRHRSNEVTASGGDQKEARNG